MNKPLVKTSIAPYHDDMQITLLAIGKCRAAYLREGARDYARRIARYAALEQIELKAERASKGRSPDDILRVEGERILQAVPNGAFWSPWIRRGKPAPPAPSPNASRSSPSGVKAGSPLPSAAPSASPRTSSAGPAGASRSLR